MPNYIRTNDGGLTAKELRRLMSYDRKTGWLIWKIKGRHCGTRAGTARKDGYRSVRIRVNGKARSFLEHRLVWLHVTGEMPPELDHKNGCKADNRYRNLRIADRQLNAQNRRRPITGKGLPLGVHRVGNKFVATIGHDRRKHHLGTFDTAEAASEEYVNAKRRLHAGCTI